MMKLKEFMIQSPNGKTHAINPKTNKTYCGHPKSLAAFVCHEHALEDLGWRFLDVLPNKNHEPTCEICKRHYNDPLRNELDSLVKDLRESVNEFLSTHLILLDFEALGRFAETIAKFMRNERKLIEES